MLLPPSLLQLAVLLLCFRRSHRPCWPKRPARDRHSRNFLNAFADDFELHGPAVIEQVRLERPDVYLKIAADLLPREAQVEVDVNVLNDVTSTLEAYRLMADLIGANPDLGVRHKLDAHQRCEAIARRDAGEALVDIARTFGVSHTKIMRLTAAPSTV